MFEIRDGIGTLTLNRPDVLNALSNELSRDLLKALQEAAADDHVRALVITGAGRAFCAGGDIAAMQRLLDAQDWASVRELVALGGTIVTTLQTMAKPTIAAVNGPAAGGGAGLALACDIRIASDRASFGIVFNRIGLVPDWGATYLLPRVVGSGKAIELTLGGEMISAEDAERFGIFNRVVPAADLVEATRETATALAAKPPLAVALARQAIHDSVNMTLKDVLAEEVEHQLRCFKSADAKEGIRAFLEKRPPVFGRRVSPADEAQQ